MRWKPFLNLTVLILFIIASFIIEMCFYKKIYKRSAERDAIDHVQSRPGQDLTGSDFDSFERDGYFSGLYYSNWSPYPPRVHFPHDIDLSRVSHIYYAFFLIDGKTGELRFGDEWSDVGMDLYKPMAIKLSKLNPNSSDSIETVKKVMPKGCLGELFYLRHTNLFSDSRIRNFKVIMCVGGWSNRDEFPRMVRDTKKVDKFIDSCVDMMFKYGFDGIDLDWEFPEDDDFEPQKYLELTKKLRSKFNELENNIFGSDKDHPKFQLSVATPAFSEKLTILPIEAMDQYVDIWNMMTYDYYGEWSETTGYHCNLFNGSKHERLAARGRPVYSSGNVEGLDGNSAIDQMVNFFKVDPRKVTLGMAAYGRGFTKVNINKADSRFINKPFHGVGGDSEGEPGMWLYNKLPIKGSQELYDPDYVSAFCFDQKTNTFVGYDNVDSVRFKAQYVKERNLAGGFWWESCGDDHRNASRSLLKAFTNEVKSVAKFDNLMFRQRRVSIYYLKQYGDDGFLSPFLRDILSTTPKVE